jgi:hypothetical protein
MHAFKKIVSVSKSHRVNGLAIFAVSAAGAQTLQTNPAVTVRHAPDLNGEKL